MLVTSPPSLLGSLHQVLGYYIRNNIDTQNLIKEIQSIASSPTDKYFFNVSEEAALSTIAGTLGNRIFNIEGQCHVAFFPFLLTLQIITGVFLHERVGGLS